MKKFIIWLLAVFVIAEMPAGEWKKIPDKDAFIDNFGAAICEEMECENAEIEVIGVGRKILFFWRCLDGEKKPPKTNNT